METAGKSQAILAIQSDFFLLIPTGLYDNTYQVNVFPCWLPQMERQAERGPCISI